LGVIPDGALLMQGGILREVGPTRRIENLGLARGAKVIDVTGCVVMPGFVDPEICPIPPFLVKDPDRLDAGTDINLQTITGKRLEWRARGYLNRMARHGSTTVGVKVCSTPGEPGEIKALRAFGLLDGTPLELVVTHVVRVFPGLDLPATIDLLQKIQRRRL